MDTFQLLRVLGDPTRYTVFRALLERKHCVRSLSKKLGITESAVSQHLRLMREAGLVYGERYGRHVHYLPSQEAADALSELFSAIREQSLRLDRNGTDCRCEYRKEENA